MKKRVGTRKSNRKLKSESIQRKKRGRPKGSKNKKTYAKKYFGTDSKTYWDKDEGNKKNESHTTSKFRGYCPCGAMIGTKDFISKLFYNCYNCRKKYKVTDLLEDVTYTLHNVRPKSKREYMEGSIVFTEGNYKEEEHNRKHQEVHEDELLKVDIEKEDEE